MGTTFPQDVYTHEVQFDMLWSLTFLRMPLTLAHSVRVCSGRLATKGHVRSATRSATLQVFAVDEAVNLEEGATKSALMERWKVA